MTREEAIEVLKDIYNYTRFDTYTTNEARTMAIKALENKPRFILHSDGKIEQIIEPCGDVLDKIRVELHATAEMHEDGDYYLRDKWIDEIIDMYKAESEDKE